jgi:hypothetical protein
LDFVLEMKSLEMKLDFLWARNLLGFQLVEKSLEKKLDF